MIDSPTYFGASACSTVSLTDALLTSTNSTFSVLATSGCSSTGAAGCSSTGAAGCSSTGALGSGVPVSDDRVSSAASPVESLGSLSDLDVTSV